MRRRNLVALMLLSGLAVNRGLAEVQTHNGVETLLGGTREQVALPGTVYVSQQDSIYAITASGISQLPLPSGGDWTQPRVLPDGSLIVVRRYDQYSDLYHVSASGQVLAQLTNDNQATSNSTLQLDHWVFWPAVGPGGTTLLFATDSPKPAPGASYEVDFSLWSAPISAPIDISDIGVETGTQWSTPNQYTGGDIEPVPLPDGNVLYTSYLDSGQGTVESVLGLETSANGTMTSLTNPSDDCTDPAVAANGTTVAMLCTNGGRQANLEVATLNGTTLSKPKALMSDCLCNSPSWSPTGDGLLFMNSPDPNGNFGLWYIPNATAAHPSSAEQVTAPDVSLDATSAANWTSR